MNPEQELQSPEVLSKQLLDAIIAHPDGHLKNASDAGSKMVRRRIRENGFTRLILPFKPVSNSDLSRLPNTELPVMIEEMEPDSPGAKSISLTTAPTRHSTVATNLLCISLRSTSFVEVYERLQSEMYAIACF